MSLYMSHSILTLSAGSSDCGRCGSNRAGSGAGGILNDMASSFIADVHNDIYADDIVRI